MRLGQSVDCVDEHGVVVAGERIDAKRSSGRPVSPPLPQRNGSMQRPIMRAACASSRTFLSLVIRRFFVVGDTASLEQDGKPLPGVAQVAIQQGRYAANLIRRKVTGKPGACSIPLFR